MSILDDAADAVTNIDPPGGIDEAARRQFDNEPGGGFIDGYQEYATGVYSPATNAASETAENAAESVSNTVDNASDVLPDWLPIAGGVILVVVTLGALLFLARPLLMTASNVTE